MLFRVHHILLLLLIFYTGAVYPQQYPFVHYTPKEGLVNNRAKSIYQDSRGRMYIATYGGLSVYDGARFINYSTDNGLVTSLVNDVVEMGDDSLWVVPNGFMMHCLVHGVLKNLKTADNYCPTINRLVKNPNGHHYAIADQGLFRFDKDRFVRVPLLDAAGKEEGNFITQAVLCDNYLYILSDVNLDKFPGAGKLLVYDIVNKRLITANNKIPFSFITLNSNNEVWLASASGIFKVNGDALKKNIVETVPVPSQWQMPGNSIVNYIYFDQQHNGWFSTAKGVYKIEPIGNRHFFSGENGIVNNLNTCIFQDRENSMWFANDQTGISKLVHQNVEMYKPLMEGFSPSLIYANPASDSSWFLDESKNALLLISNHEKKIFNCISSIASIPKAIVIGKRSFLITRNHMYAVSFLRGNKCRADLIYTDSLNSNGNAVEDNDGNLVVLSNKITVVFGKKPIRLPFGYLADEPVLDQYGRLWISTRDNKLFVYKINPYDTAHYLQLIREVNTSTLPIISPRSLTIDKLGRIWIGTRDNGLFCCIINNYSIASWKRFTTKDGLSENFITHLQCDADNTIWVSTSAGLDRAHVNNNQLYVENITSGFNIYEYAVEIRTAAAGVHWALTKSGIIKITTAPNPGTVPKEPGILFSVIISGGISLSPAGDISIPYSSNDIHFYLSSPSFLNEKQTRFQYQLEGGNNAHWSNPATLAEINFNNLSPGKYTLRVKASYLSGIYPVQSTAVSFVILPPWWQTWWFRVPLMAVMVFLMIIAAKTYVTRKLVQQKILLEKKQAVENERTRIATDMHDDLGAGLTRIKFITENISDKTNDENLKPDMDKLKSSSNELVEKMGEIIWAMNEKNNTLEDLVFYLRSYAVDYCNENKLNCDFTVPASIPETLVSGQVRRNIFLVLKESLHNTVKHAGASKVSITILAGKQFVLKVTDNGTGFEPKGYQLGNGLLNMEHRARAMNGTFSVSGIDGTGVRLEIPL